MLVLRRRTQVLRRLNLSDHLKKKQGWDKGPKGVISILGTDDGLGKYLVSADFAHDLGALFRGSQESPLFLVLRRHHR